MTITALPNHELTIFGVGDGRKAGRCNCGADLGEHPHSDDVSRAFQDHRGRVVPTAEVRR